MDKPTPPGPAWGDLSALDFAGGEYLKAAHIAADLTLRIREYASRPFPDMSGRDKPRTVLFFDETRLGLVLNEQNLTALIVMFGYSASAYRGKRITLTKEPTKIGTVDTEGIRIKGSPDISGPVSFAFRVGKGRPFIVKLQRTESK